MTGKETSMTVDMRGVVAIILGGGEGRRLFPLTATRCKPAVPFIRYRLIDIPISNSLNSNLRKIFIVSQFLSFSLHQHLIKTYQLDSFSSGFIEVLAPEQKPTRNVWFKGTADAIRQNLEYFYETPADYFLILAGDQLYQMNFQEMVKVAIQTGADLTIAALPVDRATTKRMGVFQVDRSGKIIDFHEKPQEEERINSLKVSTETLELIGLKPKEGQEYLASMGIYLFRRQALFKLLQEDVRDDFGTHLIPFLVKKGGVALFPFIGYWEDIGTISSFYQASLELTDPHPGFDCYSEHHIIYTAQNNLPGPKISVDKIEHSIICEGSILDAKMISHSIIGPRSVIKEGCSILDSVLMGHDYYAFSSYESPQGHLLEIGPSCIIKKAIIDKNVCIGRDVQLLNKNNLSHYDGQGIFIRDGIIVVARGTTLPDGFTL